MSTISATYVSSTSFTVVGNRTTEFIPGRALYCNCGENGIKYAYINYSSYSSPNTTVYLNSTESQALTANLTEVMLSRIKFQALGGNDSLAALWMARGHKSGLTLSWKDADEIYINGGSLHIDNDTEEYIYCAQSQITKQLTSLSASAWYAIYVDPPDNGLVLSASDIEYSTTMPSYNQAKKGWYHGTNTDWRCIGFIYSNASSNIEAFNISGNFYRFMDASIEILAYAGGNVNTSLDVTVNSPIGGLLVYLHVFASRYSSDGELYARRKGTSATGVSVSAYLTSTAIYSTSKIFITTAEDKGINLYCSVRIGAAASILGFLVPAGV